MRFKIERNSDEDSRAGIPYFIDLEIISATSEPGRRYRMPIFITYVGRAKHFHVEISGVRLDAQDNPHQILPAVEKLLVNLINVARFPSYVFIARRAGHVYPVYTIDDEVFITTTGGGPVFRHVELARVRRHLTEYLHRINVLGQDGRSDKLHVRGINPHTLGLRRPVFYLKKRVTDEEDFWAPVFESGTGRSVYAHAASARQEAPRQDGLEVLGLRAEVARALIADRRLRDPFDLRPDRLMPPYWEALRRHLQPEGQVLISGREFPVYSGPDGCWLGVEPRRTEDRTGLFPGESAEDVLARMTRDFARRSVLYEEMF